jgi:hypothetical protein
MITISGKTIRAQAIVDMNNWILNFKASETAKNYDTVAKQVYLNEIEKIKTRLLREI